MTRLLANDYLERLFGAGAALLLLGIGLKAWFDVDTNWDTWTNHLPFAARLWGLVDGTEFVMNDYFQPRYDGYGVLGEYFQGALWAFFHRLEAANLAGYFSLLLFLLFLKLRYAVPFHLAVIALLAVPMVQAHAATSYIDLPGGLATAVTILLVYSMYADTSPVRRGDVLLLLFAAACAANIRLNQMPIVALTLLIAAPKVLPVFLGTRGAHGARRLLGFAALALACTLVFYTPLRNTVVHGNPVYPLAVKIAGIELKHTERNPPEPVIAGFDLPGPLRWVFSTLELAPRPLYQGDWSIDQSGPHCVGGQDACIGGFMGAYVAMNLVLLGFLAWRHRTREARMAVLTVLIMSLATALMPNAARLRYWMYWMIVLVALNLLLVAHLSRLGLLARRAWQRALAVIAGVALLVVLVDTRATFVRPTFYSFDLFKAKHVDPKLIAGIKPGEQICPSLGHWSYQFLYVDQFHGDKRYTVKQANTAAACGSARRLD